MTRKRQLVNELTDSEPRKPVVMAEEQPALWHAKHTRLQLVRAIQIKGDQFVGTQGVSEIWLFPRDSADCGHGYVLADDQRGLLIQLVLNGKPVQQAFVGWGNVAGVTERDAK